jgi:hypothetical protein
VKTALIFPKILKIIKIFKNPKIPKYPGDSVNNADYSKLSAKKS